MPCTCPGNYFLPLQELIGAKIANTSHEFPLYAKLFAKFMT